MLIIIMVFKDQYVNKEKSFVFFVLYSSMINFKIPKGGGGNSRAMIYPSEKQHSIKGNSVFASAM